MAIIDSYKNVSMYVNLNGLYQVKVSGEVVWEGTSKFQADDIFGSYIDD